MPGSPGWAGSRASGTQRAASLRDALDVLDVFADLYGTAPEDTPR